jgi:hypothetical protein
MSTADIQVLIAAQRFPLQRADADPVYERGDGK